MTTRKNRKVETIPTTVVNEAGVEHVRQMPVEPVTNGVASTAEVSASVALPTTPATNGAASVAPAAKPDFGAKKTKCPITRAQFNAHAKGLTIKVGDKEFKAAAKNFSTGSLGWNVNDKMTVEIDGAEVTVQVGMNLTVVNSKELPAE